MNVSQGNGNGRGQDFDLNLAPIIDCFTVLITFMLASASYLAVGMLETQLAVEGTAATTTEKKPPPIRLDIQLAVNRDIEVRVSGKGKLKKILPATNADWDRAGLLDQIQSIKKRWPGTESVVLSAADDVEYTHLVRMMDTIRPELPSILLGGL